MSPFADKVVLITGAASGIGQELTRQLSALGARVGGLDLNVESLRNLERDLAGRPFAHAVADVTDRAALNAAVARLESKLGPTDVLIGAAGIGRETLAAVPEHAADVDATISINLIGLSNSFYAVLPGMIERKRGQLVALSSLASYAGIPRMAGYCASKAGVNALCDAFRVELRQYQIAVTTLCPGFIKTPMTEDVQVKKMELTDAVRRMLAVIASRNPFAAFPFGPLWQVRLLRYMPRFVADWLANRHYQRVKLKKDLRASGDATPPQ